MDDLARDLQQPLEDLDREIKPFMYNSDDENSEEFVYKFSNSNSPKDS
jgi:hypothetical protein